MQPFIQLVMLRGECAELFVVVEQILPKFLRGGHALPPWKGCGTRGSGYAFPYDGTLTNPGHVFKHGRSGFPGPRPETNVGRFATESAHLPPAAGNTPCARRRPRIQ